MINTIKIIVKEFVWKDFDTISTSKNKIILKSEQTSINGYKEGSTVKVIKITIGRDVITLKSLQLSNVCHARICKKEKKLKIIRNNEIILKTEKIFQNGDKEINAKETNKITICNNKIIYESRKHENDQHGVNTEEVNVSKACKNERFILLNIIMVILHKHVKKCAKEKNRS